MFKILAALVMLVATSAAAQFPGNVFVEVETRPGSVETRLHVGTKTVGYVAFPLIYKSIPFSRADGNFVMPRQQHTIFHYAGTMSFWNGQMTYYNEPGNGYTEIFHRDAELTEIAPMRSGNYLVAERRSGKLVEFNLGGIVAEHAFPGAMHVELLSDQCTVLFTSGDDDPNGNRVGRLNICTGEQLSDFATLIPGEYAGSIRQLASGDVIVANESAVLQFNRFGSLVHTYPYPVTHLGLTPDGSGFWASGTVEGQPHLLRFDPNAPHAEPQSIRFDMGIAWALTIQELVVVGEWRSALRPVKGRAVR